MERGWKLPLQNAASSQEVSVNGVGRGKKSEADCGGDWAEVRSRRLFLIDGTTLSGATMKKDFIFGELNNLTSKYNEGDFEIEVIEAMNRTSVQQAIGVMSAYGISPKTIRHEDLEMFFHAISGKTPDAPIRNRLPLKYNALSEFFSDTAERLASGKLMGALNGINALLTRLDVISRRYPGMKEAELVDLDPMIRAQTNSLATAWVVAQKDLKQVGKYAPRQSALLEIALNNCSPWMEMARKTATHHNERKVASTTKFRM